MTQLLVERSGAITTAGRDRWRSVGAVGALLSVAAIVFPSFFIGQANTDVNGDLDSKIGSHIWSCNRVPEEWTQDSDDSSQRAEWTHRDGWVVTACAWPLDPFESFDELTELLLSDPISDAGYQASSLQLGLHQVIRNVYRSETSEGIHGVVVEYSVFDREERDLHTLWIEVSEKDLEIVDQMVRRLIGSFFWIRAKTP